MQAANPPKGLLFIEQALEQIPVSRSYLYRLIDKGELELVKGLGRRVYVTEASVRGFIDRRVAEAREKAAVRKSAVAYNTPPTEVW